MATLTRPKQLSRTTSSPILTSGVPSPFPRELLINLQEPEDVLPPDAEIVGDSCVTKSEGTKETEKHDVLKEVMPSIAHVQKSCLVTLNNLLSVPNGWSPIVPDRRHSMPPGLQASGSSSQSAVESSSSALQILVANLRNREEGSDMIQISSNHDDSDLLDELQKRVKAISPSLEPTDAIFATSLVSLLFHFQRLSAIQLNSTQTLSDASLPSPNDIAGPSDPFSLLRRHLSDLQVERLSSQPDILGPGAPPVLKVEAALLWNKIDEDLEAVVAMCKERTENLQRIQADVISLPPEYDLEDDYEDYHHDALPEYEGQGLRTSMDSKSRHIPHSPTLSSRPMDEKMRLDLEGVAMAIDRLYMVAPQLHNQRVELKSSKVAQLEKASREGSRAQTPKRPGKQKETEIQELDRMLDLLSKATDRTLTDQSVILEGGLPARLEKARQKDLAKKEAFVAQLASHSSAGRLHDQDAVLQPRTKDPHALLTLPEFMRESVPALVNRADPKALLTLPEFVREPPPAQLDTNEEADAVLPRVPSQKTKLSIRNRSMSAPSLSWLRSKSGSGSSNSSSTAHSRSKSRGTTTQSASPMPTVGFEVNHVAEYHEGLQHVLVVFTVTGATPGVDIEAEVLPPFPESPSEGSDRLIVRNGAHNSLPLLLPARILPGKQEVRVQGTHFEIKMNTVGRRTPPDLVDDPPPLLDASQLMVIKPSSFICHSCSLILVQAAKINEYRDLPSEHWQELVDAWMCHSDQKLHDHVVQYGKGGFWPGPGQGLVGGSYILFEESTMAHHNLHLAEEAKKTGVGIFHQRSCSFVVYETFEADVSAASKPISGFEEVSHRVDIMDEHEKRRLHRLIPNILYQRMWLLPGEDWRLVRCLCGAVLGRCQNHTTEEGTRNVFRLLKFAIRPVSQNLEPSKIPFSAFLVEDMVEFVRAHATHRFVISDEEEELPRILIWLFKPSIRLAYTAPTPYAIPKSASIHAAKVLFKTLTPSERTSDLKLILAKYPGFPQAEYLSYPMAMCRRLAAVLRESNKAYPETMRAMTDLEVGWLQRA
ncbi:hypothetical protein H0H92_003746 [Tricholoma furcatifolium]|nr:hypothetical protein H0H92_003746 [Tricholoma furcatifolium]